MIHQYPVGDFYNLRLVQLNEHTLRATEYEKIFFSTNNRLQVGYLFPSFFRAGASVSKRVSSRQELPVINSIGNRFFTEMDSWQAGVDATFLLPSTDTEEWFLKLGYTANFVNWDQVFWKEGTNMSESYYQKNAQKDISSGFLISSGFRWTIHDHFLISCGFDYEYITFSPSELEVQTYQENGVNQLNVYPAERRNFRMTIDGNKEGQEGEGFTYLSQEEHRFEVYSVFISLGYKF